jgi:hypothetical protein
MILLFISADIEHISKEAAKSNILSLTSVRPLLSAAV